MGVIDGKTFQHGDAVAVILPGALGIPADFTVRMEYSGTTVTVRPADADPTPKRRWADVLARLDAIGPVGEVGERLPVDVPIRADG